MKLTKYILAALSVSVLASAATPVISQAHAQSAADKRKSDEQQEARRKAREKRSAERRMTRDILDAKSSAPYQVEIDCHHGSVSNADTKDQITVRFMRGNKVEGSVTRNGVNACGAFDSDEKFRFQKDNVFIDRIEIITNGSNAFFIDEIDIYGPRAIGGSTSALSEFKGLKTFGKDGGRGWCLSTDPNDANGAWKDYVSNCESMKTYVIHDWYDKKFDRGY